MVLATRAHIVKNEMLKEEEIESREMYENLLKTHLIDEKNQRARRCDFIKLFVIRQYSFYLKQFKNV